MHSPDSTKVCTKCGNEYPACEPYFRPAKRGLYGVHSRCRECERQRAREYRAEHLEQQRESSRNWNRSNKDKIALSVRKWRKNHPEADKAAKLKWELSHPEKANALSRRRWHSYKSRKLNATGRHSAEDIQLLFKTQRGRCWYCQQELDSYEIEHRIPLSRGGSNDVSNIVLSCRHCNRSKGALLPQEWNGRLL